MKFGAWNLHIVSGSAPDKLGEFPDPDAVFVGGSGGKMKEILTAVHRRNPEARVCISAIALESLQTAAETLRELGYGTDVRQIAVSRSSSRGNLTLMMAQNPVFLILGRTK